MNSKLIQLFFSVMVFAGIIYSTTFNTKIRECPVCNDSLAVNEIVSWGPYIYDWDSKYDLVYWPFTDESWFWICPNCGYCQTGNDFFTISSDEAKLLKSKLSDSWIPSISDSISFDTKLQQAITSNEIIGKDNSFWAWFNRVLIQNYRKLDSIRSLSYVKKELHLLDSYPTESIRFKEKYYLKGEYNRMLGNAELASANLNKALETNIDYSIQLTYYFSIFIIVIVIVLLWYKIRKRKIVFTILTLILICGVGYFVIQLNKIYLNEQYYDNLIIDRMGLIKDNDT